MKRIAIPCECKHGLDADVSCSFVHAPYFCLVDVDEQKIVADSVLPNPEHGRPARRGVLPNLLHKERVNTVLAGGIGERATALFESLEIEVFSCITGTVREAVEDMIAGRITVHTPCKEISSEHFNYDEPLPGTPDPSVERVMLATLDDEPTVDSLMDSRFARGRTLAVFSLRDGSLSVALKPPEGSRDERIAKLVKKALELKVGAVIAYRVSTVAVRALQESKIEVWQLDEEGIDVGEALELLKAGELDRLLLAGSPV